MAVDYLSMSPQHAVETRAAELYGADWKAPFLAARGAAESAIASRLAEAREQLIAEGQYPDWRPRG